MPKSPGRRTYGKETAERRSFTGLISQKELVSFTGQSDAYVRSHYLRGLEQISEVPGGYFISDVADNMMSLVRKNRKMREETGMQKKELIDDLKSTFGCSFMTVKEISAWTGRSQSFVKAHIVNDLPVMGRLYFVNDIADRVFELRRSW